MIGSIIGNHLRAGGTETMTYGDIWAEEDKENRGDTTMGSM
jgi:hypothetical protein